jgi:hypothetical protein
VSATAFFQHIEYVLKKLDVPALIAGYGNGVGVFLYSGFYYFLRAAVVAQVYYLGALGLHNAAHNINGGIVPIEQTGCRYYTYFGLYTHILHFVGDGKIRIMGQMADRELEN